MHLIAYLSDSRRTCAAVFRTLPAGPGSVLGRRTAIVLITLLPTLLLAASSGSDVRGQTPASTTVRRQPPAPILKACQVFLIDDIQLPAQQAGVVVTLRAQAGMQVQTGEVVGRIDDRAAQYDKLAAELQRDVALAKAENDIEVRYAQASYGVADAELTQSREINRRAPGSVTDTELRRLELTRQRALLQIDRSRLEWRTAQLAADVQRAAVAAAEDQILRRQIVVPFDGMIVDVFKHQAEWVDAGQAVLRLVRLDRLRVEGFLDSRQYNAEEIEGRSVTVELERARGQRIQLAGRVEFVSPLLQAGRKYRVRAEVENRRMHGRWVMEPGMTVSMTVQCSPATDGATGTASQ